MIVPVAGSKVQELSLTLRLSESKSWKLLRLGFVDVPNSANSQTRSCSAFTVFLIVSEGTDSFPRIAFTVKFETVPTGIETSAFSSFVCGSAIFLPFSSV